MENQIHVPNHQPGNMTWIIWGWIFGKPPGIPMYTPRCSRPKWDGKMAPKSLAFQLRRVVFSAFRQWLREHQPKITQAIFHGWTSSWSLIDPTSNWLWKIPELTKNPNFLQLTSPGFPQKISSSNRICICLRHISTDLSWQAVLRRKPNVGGIWWI